MPRRCAQVLGDGYGTPAQAALRFVLGNRDFATRVIGITEIAQLDAALEAVAQGPLPAAAMSKLDALWANGLNRVRGCCFSLVVEGITIGHIARPGEVRPMPNSASQRQARVYHA